MYYYNALCIIVNSKSGVASSVRQTKAQGSQSRPSVLLYNFSVNIHAIIMKGLAMEAARDLVDTASGRRQRQEEDLEY